MNTYIEYQSQAKGLWRRFITKIIAAIVISYYGSLFILSFLVVLLGPIVLILIYLIPITAAIWIIYHDNPMGWKNTVLFDFEKEVIVVKNSKSNSIDSTILDSDGKIYSFNEIDACSYIQYESFLFSAYYLVKIYVEDKEIKLLSIKDPNKFTELARTLKHTLKLKLR